jgi:hypothetical protein
MHLKSKCSKATVIYCHCPCIPIVSSIVEKVSIHRPKNPENQLAMCLLLVLGVKLITLSVSRSGVCVQDGMGVVFPRGRIVGGVLGLALSLQSLGPKRTDLGVRRSGEESVGVGLGVGVRDDRCSGTDSDRARSDDLLDSDLRVDSTKNVDGSVEGRMEDVKSKFKVPMLESGEMVMGCRPALKMPFLTHGRTVYFKCDISVVRTISTN